MENGGGAVAGLLTMLVTLGITVFLIAAQWKVYAKAGKPGWAAIVPIYNIIVLLEIVGKPVWWVVLFLIPFVGLIVAIIVVASLASSFGKSTGFAIGLILLPWIFIPILGFGDAQYQGAKSA